MKILTIIPCYNELFLLPYQKRHLDNNNIDLFVIDNLSNDGTTQWLINNKVNYTSLDSNGSFDLRLILEKMNKVLHEIKPDWFIYGAGDVFYEPEEGFRSMIEKADAQGFNQIESIQYDFPNMGKPIMSGNPFCNYFTVKKQHISQVLISKYHKDGVIEVDNISYPNPKIKYGSSSCFEMHAVKTVEQRMESYHRRKKAWENGLNKEWGIHYEGGAKNNFKEEGECEDIRNLPEYKLYKKLQSL